MSAGYDIFRKLDNGEKVFIVRVSDRKEAERLLHSFDENWPATYEIHETRPETK